jgi:uncharacterized membrane protein YjjP (DUF1212 family)
MSSLWAAPSAAAILQAADVARTIVSEQLLHRELEQIALVILRCAQLLIESGSRARAAHGCGALMADAFGVHLLGLRVGYASISITLGSGANTITRMITVRHHGVNQQLDQAARRLVADVSHRRLPLAEVRARLDAMAADTPKYPAWFVAVAVGLACAAFGRLLGVDIAAFVPVLLASAAGQYGRHLLLRAGTNPYVVAAAIAFTTAVLSGIGARVAGSATVDLAMIASTLLVVPGFPATNAQADIMDGYPTLGSARAVSVLMVMVFATTGIWVAKALLGIAS